MIVESNSQNNLSKGMLIEETRPFTTINNQQIYKIKLNILHSLLILNIPFIIEMLCKHYHVKIFWFDYSSNQKHQKDTKVSN